MPAQVLPFKGTAEEHVVAEDVEDGGADLHVVAAPPRRMACTPEVGVLRQVLPPEQRSSVMEWKAAVVIQATVRMKVARIRVQRMERGARQQHVLRRNKHLIEARKALFDAQHGSDKAEAFRQSVQRNRALVEKTRRNHFLVLHPVKHARYLGKRDIVTSLALIYTATFIPFEVSFIPPTVGVAAWSEGWFLVNRVLDLVFLCDLTLSFFIAYEAQARNGGAGMLSGTGINPNLLCFALRHQRSSRC